MQSVTSATVVATAARANDTTLFASLELSKSKWGVTINSPGGERFSKHVVEGGDGAGLLDLLSRSKAKAEQRCGIGVKAVVIQEAGLDGFWIHRLLIGAGIESHVVDAASIAVARRHRRAKTDAIDGETLLRTLMAWARGERRVCSMVCAPSPEEEDRRRLTRERGTLLKERIQHTNRSRACSAAKASGITIRFGAIVSNDSRGANRRRPRVAAAAEGGNPPGARADRAGDGATGCGRAGPPSSARKPRSATTPPPSSSSSRGWVPSSPRSFGWNCCSAALPSAARWRLTADWRPAPGRAAASNGIRAFRSRQSPPAQDHDRAGLFWLRHQPDLALSRWFHARVGSAKGRVRRIAIVALARKLLVALWRYVTQGVVPEGAVFKAA